MDTFKFSSGDTKSDTKEAFSGPQFYNVYKEAEFLRSSQNIQVILTKAHELRQALKKKKPGEFLWIEGMMLESNMPLLVKRTQKGISLEDYEFSLNRLIGLTAAYVYENRLRFPIIESSEAKALGLTWNNQVPQQTRHYLSAVTGTEHFIDQFSYWPLLCALRKLHLNKIPLELVVKNAMIKNDKGETMARLLIRSQQEAILLWTRFPDSKKTDLREMLLKAPPKLKKLFI